MFFFLRLMVRVPIAWVRAAAIHKIASECGGDDTQRLILMCIADHSPKVRRTALESLKLLDSGACHLMSPHVVVCLKDNDPGVRKAAVAVLACCNWEPNNDDERVALAIASENWADAARVGYSAVEPLMDALSSWRLYGAAKALSEIGDPRANVALVTAYRESRFNPDIATALGQLRVEEGIELLFEALKGYYDVPMCIAAAQALAQIGSKSAFQALVWVNGMLHQQIYLYETAYGSKPPDQVVCFIKNIRNVLRAIEENIDYASRNLPDDTQVLRFPDLYGGR